MSSGRMLITHRRMQRSADGTHEHVEWVRLSDASVFTREEVIGWMKRGYTFVAAAPSGHSAVVTTEFCAKCGHIYLRTVPDRWKDDNLDMLPPF